MMNRKDVGPVDRAMELLAKGRKTMEGLGATSGKADQILVSFIGMHGQCLEAKVRWAPFQDNGLFPGKRR